MKLFILTLSILSSIGIRAAGDTTLVLNGSKSFDPEGKPLIYLWTQISGEPAVITNPSAVITTAKVKAGKNEFQLKVIDVGNLSDMDSVIYTFIIPPPVIILPVKWGKFTYKQSGTSNTLTWTTLDETGVFNFEVQKAADAVSYRSLVSFNAKGIASSYTYTDLSSAVKTYYRIKSTDKSGAISFSTVLIVTYVPPTPPPPVKKKCFTIFGIKLWCW